MVTKNTATEETFPGGNQDIQDMSMPGRGETRAKALRQRVPSMSEAIRVSSIAGTEEVRVRKPSRLGRKQRVP